MALEVSAASDVLHMTEAEFRAWSDEDTRAEFVDGKVVRMPAVSILHYRLTRFLVRLLEDYVRLRVSGEVFGPEVQVQLRPGLWRVPDVMYLRAEHASRLTETFVAGVPDAVWEVVSPESANRDWHEKFLEYQQAGLPEYWIIDPTNRSMRLYRLDSGEYQVVEEQDGRLYSAVLPGFFLRPEWFSASPPMTTEGCLREMGLA